MVSVARRVVLEEDVPSLHVVNLVVTTGELVDEIVAEVGEFIAQELESRLLEPGEVEHVVNTKLVGEVLKLAPVRRLSVHRFHFHVDQAGHWS